MNIIKYILITLVIALLGCKDEVHELTNPKADFDYKIFEGEVHFENLSTGSDVFAWEFGDIDNGFSEEKDPVYTYLREGSYDVEVILRAGNGLTGENDIIKKTISLKDVPPSIIVDGDFSDWDNVPYANASGSGSLQKIKWVATKDDISVLLEGTAAMGMKMLDVKMDVDNNTETGLVSAQFVDGGGMDVRGVGAEFYSYINPADSPNGQPWLYAVNPGVWFTKSDIKTLANGNKAVEIKYPKKRLIELIKVPLSSEGISISFVDLKPDWSALGEIPVRNKGNDMIYVSFDSGASMVDFAFSINKGTVSFTNYSKNVSSLVWDFGDGSEMSQEQNPIHEYAENGDYEVKLAGTNTDGESISKTITVSITGIVPPVESTFTYAVVEDGTVAFTNTSKNATTYLWNFGDNSATSTEESPTHIYTKSGTYNVILKATNSVGDYKISQQSVTVTVPILGNVQASFTYIIMEPGRVKFTNTSENADVYEWSFGDGSEASALESPQHIYARPGTYVVTLNATNSTTNETKTVTQDVVIEIPIKIDGSFSDWDDVPDFTAATPSGIVSKMKYKVEENKLKVLVVTTSADNTRIEFVLNADNSSSTGWKPTFYSSTGIEIRALAPEGLYNSSAGTPSFITGTALGNIIGGTSTWMHGSGQLKSIGGGEYAMEIAYDLTQMESKTGVTMGASAYFGFVLRKNDASWTVLGAYPAIGADLVSIPLE